MGKLINLKKFGRWWEREAKPVIGMIDTATQRTPAEIIESLPWDKKARELAEDNDWPVEIMQIILGDVKDWAVKEAGKL